MNTTTDLDHLIQLNENSDPSDTLAFTGKTSSSMFYSEDELDDLLAYLDATVGNCASKATPAQQAYEAELEMKRLDALLVELAEESVGPVRKIDSKPSPADTDEALRNKAHGARIGNPGQCATNPPINGNSLSKPTSTSSHSDEHKEKRRTSSHSPPFFHPSASSPLPANAPETPKTRTPRGKLAQIAKIEDMVMSGMKWNGKRRNDPKALGDAGKFSVAIATVEATGGHAFSLNLGARRHDMLLAHSDPRRRMSANLNKHLREAGFPNPPYAFAFDVEPKANRVHLHGVIDTSGLSVDDLKKLDLALRRAGSEASGALGGERQVKLKEVSYAPGWLYYTLREQKRAQRVLGIENVVFINTPMNKLARDHFNAFSNEANRRSPASC